MGPMSVFRRRAFSATASVAMALASAFWLSGASAQADAIQVGVGDTSTIELDGNPSTGYSWVLDDGASENPELVRVEDLGYAKRELAPGQRPVLGAPSKYQFRVTGLEAGSVKLVFNYGRGSENPPAKTQTVTVEVAGTD